MVDGAYLAHHGDNLTYRLLVSCEESLEMLGATAWIYTILIHLQGHRLRPIAENTMEHREGAGGRKQVLFKNTIV